VPVVPTGHAEAAVTITGIGLTPLSVLDKMAPIQMVMCIGGPWMVAPSYYRATQNPSWTRRSCSSV
jgi:hypothetical protein